MFLQLKESPYFEAAQAYGAGNFRIIFRYLLPRTAPTLPSDTMVESGAMAIGASALRGLAIKRASTLEISGAYAPVASSQVGARGVLGAQSKGVEIVCGNEYSFC